MSVPEESRRVVVQELINIRESLYRLHAAGAWLGAMTEDHKLVLVEVLWPGLGVVGEVEWDAVEEQWVIGSELL